MPWTLTTTAPDGTVTVNDPVTHGAQAALAVGVILASAAPWLTERERRRAALQVSANSGQTWVHGGTGYRFLINHTDNTPES